MLKIMEDEVKIFRAWLKKYIREDGSLSGKDISDKIGISAQRLSQYHSGRIDNGTRSFPKIPFKIRQAILEATRTPYTQMLEVGRRELAPPVPDDDQIIRVVREELQKAKPPPENVVNYQAAKNKEHHQTIDRFQDQETALEINKILVKIESLDRESLGEIKEMLYGKLTAMEKRHRKEPPAEAQGER